MGTWIRGHLWQVSLALLAIGGWVARMEGAASQVREQTDSVKELAEEVARVKWSLDSLRIELRHLNRNVEELLRKPD